MFKLEQLDFNSMYKNKIQSKCGNAKKPGCIEEKSMKKVLEQNKRQMDFAWQNFIPLFTVNALITSVGDGLSYEKLMVKFLFLFLWFT